MHKPDNAIPRGAVDVEIAVKEVDDGAIPKILCALAEVAEISLGLVRVRDCCAAL